MTTEQKGTGKSQISIPFHVNIYIFGKKIDISPEKRDELIQFLEINRQIFDKASTSDERFRLIEDTYKALCPPASLPKEFLKKIDDEHKCPNCGKLDAFDGSTKCEVTGMYHI